MKKLIRLISLSFAICLTTLGLGQSNNDTICFELDNAKNLLKYAEKGYFCDSIINQYEAKDSIYKEVIKAKDVQLNAAAGVITEQAVKIKRLRITVGALSGLSLLLLLVQLITG